jgi:hypothetical protein
MVVFTLISVSAVSGQSRSRPRSGTASANANSRTARLPSAFGTYYESTSGLVRLPGQSDPTEPVKNPAKKQQMTSSAPVVAGNKPSFILFLKEGSYAMNELRLLRLSRMTLGFAFTSSGPDIELGGDPIKPVIEPIAGRKGMFRVKINDTLTSDLYLFLEHYQKSGNIHLNGRGYFKVD